MQRYFETLQKFFNVVSEIERYEEFQNFGNNLQQCYQEILKFEINSKTI